MDRGTVGGRYALASGGVPGAHSTTFEGRRLEDGTPVVLDVLAPTDGLGTRLARHASSLLAVSGRHLVRVLEVLEEHEGGPALVREQVVGEPLSRYRHDQGLDAAGAVDVVSRVLDALSDLHAGGVVHGALTDRVVLVDLALPLRPLPRLTGWGMAVLSGAGGAPSDDVRAAGLLLLGLLGAAPPSGWPAPLDAALAAMLAADPGSRPTAGRARDALEGVRLDPSVRVSGAEARPAPVVQVDRPHTDAAGVSWARASQVGGDVGSDGPDEHVVRAAPGGSSWLSWPSRPTWPARPPRPRAGPGGPPWRLAGRAAPGAPTDVRDTGVGRGPGRPRWVLAGAALSAGALGLALLAAAVLGWRDEAGVSSASVADASAVATHEFAQVTRADGLTVDRTWTLAGETLRSETVVRNPGAKEVPASLDEVVPRSVARDPSALLLVPEPDAQVAPSGVLRYLVQMRPGEVVTWRWEAPVGPGRRLALMARDAEVAQLVWESSRTAPRATPATVGATTAPEQARPSSTPTPTQAPVVQPRPARSAAATATRAASRAPAAPASPASTAAPSRPAPSTTPPTASPEPTAEPAPSSPPPNP